MNKSIPFSPPDITQKEIDEVVEVLKSGWITSGPKVAKLEQDMSKYCGTNHTVLVSSNTMGLELILKVLDIKAGDEVITTPYTYTATSNVIIHRGIKPTFVDVKKGSFMLDEQKLYEAVTPRTKAIIPVDFAGVPVDYDAIRAVLKDMGREDIVIIVDSAHSFGATYKGKKVGSQGDFHVFSFHAVKNFTTAEGGAIVFNDNHFAGKEDLYKEFKVTSLGGQTKDALSKMKAGAWKYDVVVDGMKCNMTDIQAAIGLAQLERFDGMIEKRKAIVNIYNNALSKCDWAEIPFSKDEKAETCYHLYPLRIKGFSEEQRNEVIQIMADKGIATNVHFIPLPMFSYYKSLGYSIKDYPNAYEQYANEITVPLYSLLSEEDAKYVVDELIKTIESIKNK